MNLIGHNYISYKTLGHINANTLIGSHLPDFVPFLPSSVLNFKEVHENHQELLNFIAKNYPSFIDIPLSMMCHSVEFGADEYNKDIETWLLENNKDLKNKIARMITKASNISYETAYGPRLHNYLWCGIDFYLIKNNPENITDKFAEELKNINYPETAEILADFYKKGPKDIENNLRDHFTIINFETFRNEKSFTIFWSKFLSSLQEGDSLDINKGINLLEFIYETFESKWKNILEKTENKVGEKTKRFIINERRRVSF
ncbi:hypothetical protein KKF11_00640 [Patescibacteria group bacterium]|nr:hypothetical protein [Patescibacteria group bacterium]